MKNFPDVNEHWAKGNIDLASQVLNKEQTSLPNNEILTNVVLNQELETLSAFKAENFDQVYTILDTYTIGFYKIHAESTFSELVNMIEQGVNINMERLTTPNLTVLEKSNRFAKIEPTNLKYSFTVEYAGSLSLSKETSGDEVYLLKKMSDGEREIYANHNR